MASRSRTCGAKWGNEFRMTRAVTAPGTQREGQRDRAAERFADNNRTTFDRRDHVDDVGEIGGQQVETLGVVSQRIGGNAIGSLEAWDLSVEQLPGPIHAGHQDHGTALATN